MTIAPWTVPFGIMLFALIKLAVDYARSRKRRAYLRRYAEKEDATNGCQETR